MAIVPAMIDNSNCFCNSIVVTDCNGNLVCADLCEMIRECPSIIGQRLRFFGDLIDTPAVCSPNKILGTDGACAGVVLLDPCTLFATCGFTDNLVRASGTDLASGTLFDKLKVCVGGSLQLTKVNIGTVNEYLQMCFVPTVGTIDLIDTGDGPGVYPLCNVLGVPRPGIIQSRADQTGRQVTCPVERAIGRLVFDTSSETEITASTDGFFTPSGAWTKYSTSVVGMATASYMINTVGAVVPVNNLLRVARDGWYTVGMKGVIKVSHGVHSVRVQLWRVNAAFVKLEELLDDRFEGPLFRDASMEDSYAGTDPTPPGDGTSFNTSLGVHFDANMARGMVGFGFGQSKPIQLLQGEYITLIIKANTLVSGETYFLRPKIGVVGASDAGMTNGTGPGAEIRMIEEPLLYYPIA